MPVREKKLRNLIIYRNKKFKGMTVTEAARAAEAECGEQSGGSSSILSSFEKYDRKFGKVSQKFIEKMIEEEKNKFII